MKLALRKSKVQVYVVTSDAFGPGYAFPENALLAVTGELPAQLLPYVTRMEEQILPGRRVMEIDAEMFAQDVAAETRRQSEVSAPDATWTHGEVIARLFNGDSSTFEAAAACGFPPRSGARVSRRGMPENYWRERAVRKWAEQIKAVAGALSSAR